MKCSLSQATARSARSRISRRRSFQRRESAAFMKARVLRQWWRRIVRAVAGHSDANWDVTRICAGTSSRATGVNPRRAKYASAVIVRSQSSRISRARAKSNTHSHNARATPRSRCPGSTASERSSPTSPQDCRPMTPIIAPPSNAPTSAIDASSRSSVGRSHDASSAIARGMSSAVSARSFTVVIGACTSGVLTNKAYTAGRVACSRSACLANRR